MRSICFFAAYFTSRHIPYYVTVYLKELKKHFDEVQLLCSQPELDTASLDFLAAEQIGLSVETNEGFDFGLWYKAFQKNNVLAYRQIALVNDSCILFKPLDEFMAWSQSVPAEVQGITASDAVAPHVQSYFLILQQAAIPHVVDYFNTHGILKNIGDVIRVYEIGLCTYLLSKGLRMAAYVDNNGYSGEFSPYYRCVDYHLANGIPLIKKKILFSSYRKDELFTLARMNFSISADHYTRLIKASNKQLLLDPNQLKADRAGTLNLPARVKYELTRRAIALLHIFRQPAA